MDRGDGGVTTERPASEGVGAMLRARRQELGLSQADVAGVVKLPARRIDAMEAERWDELPNGPYLRGFLRNVARALDLDATTLTDRVDASLVRSRSPDRVLVAPGATNVMLPRRSGPADDRRGGRALVLGAVAFAAIAALIAWSGTESFDRTLMAARTMLETRGGANDAQPTATGPTETLVSVPAPSGARAEAPADPAAALPAAVTTAPVAASAGAVDTAGSPASPLALAIRVTEDSWVEVQSGDGRVLIRRNMTAGSEQELDGQAPFTIVVGNARGVAMRYRGEPVDLAPYTRGQVARLTLS